VTGLYARGWRPWPRTPGIPQPGAGDPANAEFKTGLRRLKGEPE
jgi:hypothetical protein